MCVAVWTSEDFSADPGGLAKGCSSQYIDSLICRILIGTLIASDLYLFLPAYLTRVYYEKTLLEIVKVDQEFLRKPEPSTLDENTCDYRGERERDENAWDYRGVTAECKREKHARVNR